MIAAVKRDGALSQDLSSWPVQRLDSGTATITAWEYDPAIERQRAEIVALIRHISRYPVNWSDRDPIAIDSVSAATAIAFIQQLPSDKALPRIAPDGDGGIALLWDNGDHRALIAIDRTVLLLIRDPGGINSFHFSPMMFDGETIPLIVLNDLPRR